MRNRRTPTPLRITARTESPPCRASRFVPSNAWGDKGSGHRAQPAPSNVSQFCCAACPLTRHRPAGRLTLAAYRHRSERRRAQLKLPSRSADLPPGNPCQQQLPVGRAPSPANPDPAPHSPAAPLMPGAKRAPHAPRRRPCGSLEANWSHPAMKSAASAMVGTRTPAELDPSEF
jgi:hypothetical protein